MVGTRSNSRSEVSVTTTAVTAATTSTSSTSQTGAIPRQVDLNATVIEAPIREDFNAATMDVPRQEDLDASGGSFSTNSLIVTPPFSSMSAQGVIDAFRQNNVPIRPPNSNINRRGNIRSTGNVTQADLRNFEDRLLDLVPRIIQQSLQAQAQQSGSSHIPPRENERFPDLSQPPPSFSDAPYRQLQVQQWPNTTFNPQQNYHNNFATAPEVPVHAIPPLQRNQPSQGTNIRIDKWGILFDGNRNTTSIEDFVFRVETLRADYGCNWQDILKSFHHLLRGPALDWFWDYRRFNNVNRWEDFKTALVTQFHRFDSDFDIQRKILDRKQHNQETFEDFYNSVIRLRNQLRSPISEQDIVSIMKSNLKAPMAQLLFSVQVNGLAQFAKEGRRAENLLNNHRPINNRYPPRAIHELEYENVKNEEHPEIDALNTTSTRKLICWNCKTEGHTFMECEEEKRNLFCYKCGMENTVTPRCTVCQGNQKANLSRVGMEARSKTTYPKQY